MARSRTAIRDLLDCRDYRYSGEQSLHHTLPRLHRWLSALPEADERLPIKEMTPSENRHPGRISHASGADSLSAGRIGAEAARASGSLSRTGAKDCTSFSITSSREASWSTQPDTDDVLRVVAG